MKQNSLKNQYYAALCVNIMSLSYGAICGWPSSSFLVLQSKDSPLNGGPMTDEQASWVGSLLCVGGLSGNILFAWMANYCGRKLSLLLTTIPAMLSLILIIIASNVNYLYASRILTGLAGGGVFSIIPLFVTEISEDRVRGALGSYLVTAWNVGLLIAYILGSFVSYTIFPYLLLTLPTLFILLFIRMPETPPYLLKNNKIKEGEKSLAYYRNLNEHILKEIPEEFLSELEKLKTDYTSGTENEKKDEQPVSWEDFTSKPAIKAFIFGVALMGLNQFCGCFAMINYTATIFVKAGSTLSPNKSAIIVAVIQLFGSYFSVILVERMGRKILISGSAFGTGLGFLCMGTYLYLDILPDYDVTNFKWIPLASFSFVIFIASWGVLTLPFLFVSELAPPRIRSHISGICMTLLWIFAFLLIKYLTAIIEALGMHGAMFFFAACCFAGGIFVMSFIPETKGRSINEIMALLE